MGQIYQRSDHCETLRFPPCHQDSKESHRQPTPCLDVVGGHQGTLSGKWLTLVLQAALINSCPRKLQIMTRHQAARPLMNDYNGRWKQADVLVFQFQCLCEDELLAVGARGGTSCPWTKMWSSEDSQWERKLICLTKNDFKAWNYSGRYIYIYI